MTHISRVNMGLNKFRTAAANLQPALLEILAERGPSSTQTLRYFLYREHEVTINDDDLAYALDLVEAEGKLEFYQKPGTVWGIYHLPGEKQRASSIPEPPDYPTAFIDLYFRYQALRGNPELAQMNDEYIDSLYLPQPKEQTP